MKIRVWHAVGGCIALSGLLLGLVVWLYTSAVTPEETSPELRERTTATAKTTNFYDEVPTGPLELSGQVFFEDGGPADGVVVEAYSSDDSRVEATSDIEGHFSLEIEGPAKVRPDDVASRPKEVIARESRADLAFVVPYRCPLDVYVEGPDGEPAHATVQVYVSSDLGRGSAIEVETDTTGLASFPRASCGVATVKARAVGLAMGYRDDVDTVVTQEITMKLVEGVLFEGSVTDGDGAPLPDALINAAHDSESTDADGRFEMLVDPDSLSFTMASLDGYETDTAVVRVGEGQDHAEHDYVLFATRGVEVYCAGMPDDSCVDIGLIMCTQTWLPFGEACDIDEDPVVCPCPAGKAAVRASGEAVMVQADDTEVWLDFRYGGGVVGRVFVESEPAECTASAVWLPQSNADLMAGLSAVRFVQCDEEGRFSHVGLRPGSWMLEIRSGGITRSLGTETIDDEIVDVGDIELQGGGQITGFVVDGLTQEGAPNVPITAVESGNMSGGVNMPSDFDGYMPNMGNSISGSEGRFTIYGLPDGEYDVFVSTSPFTTVGVTVSDGKNQSEVELETGGADLLDEHGFGLATGEDGDLVVDAVEEGSSAEEAGLVEGDRLDGVRIFGTDPAEAVPGWDDTMTNMILENYNGPGVSLVVERDGDVVEIDL